MTACRPAARSSRCCAACWRRTACGGRSRWNDQKAVHCVKRAHCLESCDQLSSMSTPAASLSTLWRHVCTEPASRLSHHAGVMYRTHRMKSSMRDTDTLTSRMPSKSFSSGDCACCGAQHGSPSVGDTMSTCARVEPMYGSWRECCMMQDRSLEAPSSQLSPLQSTRQGSLCP